MQNIAVANNLRPKAENFSSQEMLCFLLKEIEGESISMFLVKDEEEFLSVLGLREEALYDRK